MPNQKRLKLQQKLHLTGAPPIQGPPVQGTLHFIGPPVQGAHHFRNPSLYGATTQAAHFLCQIKKGPNCSKNCIYPGTRGGLNLPVTRPNFAWSLGPAQFKSGHGTIHENKTVLLKLTKVSILDNLLDLCWALY